MTQEAPVEVKPMWAVKVFRGITGGIRNALGQLATKLFWTKLSEIIVKEMINAFVKTLGAKLLTYGTSREDPEIKRTAQTVTQGTGSSAFSGSTGYSRPESSFSRPDYAQPAYTRPDYRSYPVPVATPDNSFPGFGGK